MCGIIGFQGAFDHGALSGGIREISHRGPDDSGEFHDLGSGTALGHARLSIIDLSPQGHQPMADDSGRFQLIFNGEIYNYRELRAQLEAKGHRFRGHSDTEVILHLFMDEGSEMLARLNGIFTIAIWDRTSGELLVARDALGVKPLYVAELAEGFAFCSEIKGLLRIAPRCGGLDCAALDRYLTFLWCPGDGTPLDGVRKLLPGEAVQIRGGRVCRRWNWYQLPAFRGVTQDLCGEAAVRGTEGALRAAVQRQMVADVPVGAFLSGGLDSSAVVAFARESNPGIKTPRRKEVNSYFEKAWGKTVRVGSRSGWKGYRLCAHAQVVIQEEEDF